MKKLLLILFFVKSIFAFSQNCPIHFLGNDTTVIIICSNDKVNVSNIFRTAGMTATWNIRDSSKADLGTCRLIVDSSSCRDTAFVTIRQDIKNWTGKADSNWTNSLNWSGEKVPDSNSNVIISSGGYPCILSSNAKIATLQVSKNAQFKIQNNPVFVITNKCDTLTPLIGLDQNTVVIEGLPENT